MRSILISIAWTLKLLALLLARPARMLVWTTEAVDRAAIWFARRAKARGGEPISPHLSGSTCLAATKRGKTQP